ncbi:unnamed protein product [Victoria cruziana]
MADRFFRLILEQTGNFPQSPDVDVAPPWVMGKAGDDEVNV